MINEREQSSIAMIEQADLEEATTGKVVFLVRKIPLPRKLGFNSHTTSASRDGVFFLLLLLIVALVIHRYRERNSDRIVADEEAPRDDDFALPGPHIDANTRMHLDNRPQTFYDWVRSSNAASQPPVNSD